MGVIGVVGVLSFHEGWDVVKVIKYPLMALKHRGNGQYFIATLSDDLRTGLVNDLEFKGFSGWTALACAYIDESSVGVVKCSDVTVAYCVEGQELKPEDVCGLVNNGKQPETQSSVIALTSDGRLMGFRPSGGLRNLALGAYGFDLAIISNETSAINAIGGSVRRFIEPGTLVTISRNSVEFNGGTGREGKVCSLELIYMARPDSEVDGHSVYAFRVSLAKRMAKGIRVNVDSVVGVPETGVLYAVKVGESLSKPVELALSIIERRRSALTSEITDKLSSIHLKVNPVVNAIRGKRLLLIDDSLVSGLTIKEISQALRHRAGVKEIHVAIASPRIVRRCPYGINMPPDEQLLANAFPNDEDLIKLLEVDSISWLQLSDLIEAAEDVGIRGGSLCIECFLRRRS